jgi:transposase
MVEERGLPVALALSPGQASDKAAVQCLLDASPGIADVVVDRGYDARAIVDLIAARGGTAHIPTQRDRKVQRSVEPRIYRQRNLVKHFFNKLKHFRKIATRYEKTARNYLAAVIVASTRLWLRVYESTS